MNADHDGLPAVSTPASALCRLSYLASKMKILPRLWVVAIFICSVWLSFGSTVAGGWDSGLSEFFRSVDSDGDGQIEPAEAMQYIGDSFGTELQEKDMRLAVQQMSKNLDGSDSGHTVSKAEVEQHLRSLLKVRIMVVLHQ